MRARTAHAGGARQIAREGDVGAILGWGGGDLFRPRAGDDRVFANAGDTDPQVQCGDGLDRALLDHWISHMDWVTD